MQAKLIAVDASPHDNVQATSLIETNKAFGECSVLSKCVRLKADAQAAASGVDPPDAKPERSAVPPLPSPPSQTA